MSCTNTANKPNGCNAQRVEASKPASVPRVKNSHGGMMLVDDEVSQGDYNNGKISLLSIEFGT